MTPTIYAGVTRQEMYDRIMSMGRDFLLRYAHVPFVVAEGAWDYADSVIDMSILARNQKTKGLSRAIRQLRKEYESKRREEAYSGGVKPTLLSQGMKESFLRYEEDLSDYFNSLCRVLRGDIETKYPELNKNDVSLLIGVYTCHIVLEAIFRYNGIMMDKIKEACGLSRLNDIIPTELYKLNTLILEYAGDKRMRIEERERLIDELVENMLDTRLAGK